jgi:hypothetical protein
VLRARVLVPVTLAAAALPAAPAHAASYTVYACRNSSGAIVPRGAGGAWTFTAPAGTRIGAASVWRFAKTAIAKGTAYAWWNGVFHDAVNSADAITH